jgi:hypothetical protein
MSHADINKWISGETEVFDPRQLPPPSRGSNSNSQKESSRARSSFWRSTQPVIGILLGAVGIATLIVLVILSRQSEGPFAAANTAQHSAKAATAMGVSRIDDPAPDLHKRTTALSTALLKDWIDPSPSPPVASAPLPPPEPGTRPALPEPPSEERLARAPRVDKLDRALTGSSRPSSAKLPSRPLWSDTAARLPMSEAPPLTERANAFMNSYWQTVDDGGDRVLPYLSSIYAPMVTYYGKLLPKQAILRDKYYFVRRWPIRQTWSSPGAESPRISCNEAAAQCEISGFRDYEAVNAERGARAAGVVRYRYAVRFSEGSPQIIAEESNIVGHD